MASNSIDRVKIKGFKSIGSLDIELRPINVLVGANGAGKSNFLGIFRLLRENLEGRLPQFIARSGGAEKLLHFGSKITPAIEVELSFSGGAQVYHLDLERSVGDGLSPTERMDRQVSVNSTTLRYSLLESLGPELTGWRDYHFHDTGFSSPMKKTAKTNDNRFLRRDGSNLAPFLYFLRIRQQNSYELIRRTIQRVAPFFQDFNLEPLQVNPDDIKMEWKHRDSDQYFDVSSLSDGTLRFMALATLFLQPKENRPSLILVDEPELGLHPFAIELLASMIQFAAVDTQIIISTQSPQLLDSFEPDDVIVADYVDGATQLRRLDSGRLAKWLEDYSLGQLWEKNEFGGRPGSV